MAEQVKISELTVATELNDTDIIPVVQDGATKQVPFRVLKEASKTEFEETDPTVPLWAKQPEKPEYTAEEVGARPNTWTPSAEEVGALPVGTKIPSNTSDLVNDSGFVTSADVGGVEITSGTPEKESTVLTVDPDAEEVEVYTAPEIDAFIEEVREEIPEKTSELSNDSGFITKTVGDLVNYYRKEETYSQEEINQKLSAIPKFSIQPVSSLPTSDISATTVYLLKTGEETDNLYTEYIYVNDAWEYLGKQTVDLTGYALEEDIPTKLSELTNDVGFITNAVSDLVNYYKKTEVYSRDEIDAKGYLTEHQDLSAYAKKATTLAGYGITDAATAAEVSKLSEEKVSKTGVTLGVHSDGLIYLFIDGEPTGTGVEPGTSGDVVGYIDSENNIVLTGTLTEGTYTVKYEMEDGTLVDIGTLSNVEEEPEPTYTNLADPTSSDWAEGMRFNSSGTLVAVDAGVNGAATNYIGGSFAVGDVVRVKGMDLRTYRTAIYDKNKAQKSVGTLLNASYYFSDISVDATSAIFTIKSTSDNALTGGGYIRFCGPLNGTSKDVIITINEEIV